ncbi:flagellar associated isoform A [Chlorella sorokiniana]|uniref:Flagellar associated isoform A n=1 Tax=Chlorella sorokiniana TaxID=3076 RepID=A0A2P6TGH8_CHLSO|nr:flagellar associated isoform A [Chlorella sorokiniana]|eukprot:PRW33224.1 flagellar associated isoform A [Chlorella sorokiniana]
MEEDDPKKEAAAAGEGGKAYDSIELGFQEVLAQLAGDTQLERFREEYEKVFRALKKSHDSEKRLVKRCRELNAEIVAGAAKVQAALKLSEEDQATITALKKEIENSWRMVDGSHEKELKSKEQIAQLKQEISSLTKLLEQGAAVGLAEEADLEELIRQKEALVAERDGQVQAIVALRGELADFAERMRAAEAEKAGLEAEIQSLRDSVAQRKAETDREIRRRERLEKEMKELRASLEARQQDIRDKQAAVQQSAEHVEKLKGLLRESQQASERLQKEYNALSDKVARLHHTLEEHVHTNTQLLADNSQRQVEIKAKEDEIRTLREEGAKAAKAREAMAAKLQQLEKQKGEVERTRDELKAEAAGLERELELARRQIDIERRKQEEMVRERERLNKARTTAENATAKHADLVRVTEVMKANLESEAAALRQELAKQEQVIRGLEREKERFAGEAAGVNAKYRAAVEEVAARDAAIADLQRKIAEGEARLRAQQELYESVRSERNSASRSLVEVQDEVGELKRRLAVTAHQADQLKGEVAVRDGELQREKYDKAKADKDCEALRAELNRVAAQVREQEAAMAEHAAQITQLQGAIAEAEQARLKLKREHDAVVGERDALGAQLVRRNEEARLLYEKVRLQQSALARGQAQYRDRLAEIRALKLKVAGLKRELAQLKSSVANADVLRREVHHLNRELLAERTRVKALSEELENPLNVHRWRKLEGSDPTTYEMILKIQALQKRLIAKTEEVVEQDLQIQEKERLYLELKSILARQPGPEAAEQLNLYQATLREKTKQMKSLASELNMYQSQVQEYKYEIERLQREMNEVKQKYFAQKKLAQQQGGSAAAAAAGAGGAGGSGGEELIPAARGSASPSPVPGAASLKASPAVSAVSLSVSAIDLKSSVGAAAATGALLKDLPLGEQLLNPKHLKNNMDILTSTKIFASLLAGVFAGVVGITGYKGFLVYLLAHALASGLLALKAGGQPQRYFPTRSQLVLAGVFSQTELLTFILFWTVTNNLVYLF